MLRMENVICTPQPHIGYVERESYELDFSAAFCNILAFDAGDTSSVANQEALQHARRRGALRSLDFDRRLAPHREVDRVCDKGRCASSCRRAASAASPRKAGSLEASIAVLAPTRYEEVIARIGIVGGRAGTEIARPVDGQLVRVILRHDALLMPCAPPFRSDAEGVRGNRGHPRGPGRKYVAFAMDSYSPSSKSAPCAMATRRCAAARRAARRTCARADKVA